MLDINVPTPITREALQTLLDRLAAETRFSIQSISKAHALVLAMQRLPPEAIWSRVGREPSGLLFNSIVQLEVERGVPRNPFINAGALVARSEMEHKVLPCETRTVT